MRTFTNANVTDIVSGYYWIKGDDPRCPWEVVCVTRSPSTISIWLNDDESIYLELKKNFQTDLHTFELRGPIPEPDVSVTPDRYRELLEARVAGVEAMLTAIHQQHRTGDIDLELMRKVGNYLCANGPL